MYTRVILSKRSNRYQALRQYYDSTYYLVNVTKEATACEVIYRIPEYSLSIYLSIIPENRARGPRASLVCEIRTKTMTIACGGIIISGGITIGSRDTQTQQTLTDSVVVCGVPPKLARCCLKSAWISAGVEDHRRCLVLSKGTSGSPISV